MQSGDDDDGSYVDIDVTSPVPFNELLVFEPFGGAMLGQGILTPGLRSANMAAPQLAMIEVTEGPRGLGNGMLGTEYALQQWDIGGGPSKVDVLAVVTQPDGSLMPVAYAESGRLQYDPADGAAYEATGTLPLAQLTGPVELWGAGTTLCARIVDGATGKTTYLIGDSDTDCDGIPDENDCQPDAYCDASNPTELAACTRGTGGC